MNARFQSFAEFYPFYLSEHSDPTCRRLHFFGSACVIFALLFFVLTLSWWALAAAILSGYGCAWIGHFFFEHNRPATFRYPFYSLLGDWVMAKDMLSGKIKF